MNNFINFLFRIIPIIIITLCIIVFAFIILGGTLDYISKSKCEKYCKTFNTSFFETIPSGKLDIKDLCVCYLDDEIKTKIFGK